MSSKNWLRLSLILLSVLLGSQAVLTIYVDPYFHYHPPIENLSYTWPREEIYTAAGIADNFDYDAAIIGTSMCQNFQPSYLAQKTGETIVKNVVTGGHTADIRLVLEKTLENNTVPATPVNHIYLGLDLNMLEKGLGFRQTVPHYLYDNNFLNDVEYVFNKDILFDNTLPVLNNTLGNEPSDLSFDNYLFDSNWRASQQAVIEPFLGKSDIHVTSEVNQTTLGEAILAFDNIKTVIENHPEINFTVFFPPYSILFWYNENAATHLAILEYMMGTLRYYDNVEMHLFLGAEEIVTNLFNYRDIGHYNHTISTYILDCLVDKRYLVTDENYDTRVDDLKTLIYTFDYGLFTGESNPLPMENNIYEYIGLLKELPYLTFFVSKNTPVTHPELLDGLSSMGCDTSALVMSDNSFAGIYFNGSALYEHSSASFIPIELNGEPLEHSSDDSNTVSLKYTFDNTNLIIDNMLYRFPYTRLEDVIFVVYDPAANRLLDIVSFDPNNNYISKR